MEMNLIHFLRIQEFQINLYQPEIGLNDNKVRIKSEYSHSVLIGKELR